MTQQGSIEGEFSDNLLTLEGGSLSRCEKTKEPRAGAARRVCFTSADVAGAAEGAWVGMALDLETFRGNLTATALNAEGGMWWD